MENSEKQIIKELAYKIVLPAMIISLICLALLMTCNKQPIVKPPPNVLDKRIDSIKVHINKDSLVIDSLMKLKPKVVVKYKTKYDTIYQTAPDTCQYYLTQLNNECLKLDSFNTGIITRQETQLISYSELVGTMSEQSNMYVLRHNEDSLSILKLDKKLKRTRRIAIGSLGIGLIGGLFIK
ncbi:hypothetical protein UFOVP1393_32 [uncultured Caudovirales phage]|uniref:Uncharacterized protein n=1 Tax=uncultured Caudovirales phage TaxID=2100421 RepID=A0A6J5S6M6_9CAUD|nr:hypothetical protein UFOVP1393_32 [uncultured Caudovirales phage]